MDPWILAALVYLFCCYDLRRVCGHLELVEEARLHLFAVVTPFALLSLDLCVISFDPRPSFEP